MHIDKISIGRGKKFSANYQSQDYHVSLSIFLNENDDVIKAHKLALSNIKILEMEEVKKIKEEL